MDCGLPAQEIRYAGLGTVNRVAQTDFFYDGGSGTPTKGNLTREVRWHAEGTDPETRWTYDTLGNVRTITDAGGSLTTFEYDTSQTFVVKETNHLQQATHTVYYGVNAEAMDEGLYGQVKRVTDPNGDFTTTTYDPLGRVERVTHPDGLFTETAYKNFGRGVKRQYVQTYWELSNAPTDDVYPNAPWGNLAKQYFDGLGRVITDEQPGVGVNSEPITDIEFDVRGHVTTRSLPHFRVDLTPSTPFPVITYQTDPLGRVTQTTYPDGRVERACYGAGVTVTVDANGHKTRTVRDAYGQVVTVQEYQGEFASCSPGAGSPYATTTYAYDVRGNLTQVTDTAGNVTTMDYDSLSRKLTMDDPDMGEWTYAYDAVGNLTQQTDAKGQRLHFRYDRLHRRVQKDYETPKTPGKGDIVWHYDENQPGRHGIGRLTRVAHRTATIPSATELWYDERGRVAKRIDTVGAKTFTIQTAYDGLNRETARTYPDDSVVQNTYTGPYLGSVGEVGGNSYATIGGYTPLGKPGQLTTGDGVTTTYGYRPDNFRLQSLLTQRPEDPLTAATLQQLTYDYDAGGNVKNITDPQHGNQIFGYDGWIGWIPRWAPMAPLTMGMTPSAMSSEIRASVPSHTNIRVRNPMP